MSASKAAGIFQEGRGHLRGGVPGCESYQSVTTSTPSPRQNLAVSSASPAGALPPAVVVLGCRLSKGVPGTTLESRLKAALQFHSQWSNNPAPRRDPSDEAPCGFVLCGGQRWQGVSEAEAMRTYLLARGVAPELLTLENASRTTAENASFCAALLAERGISRIALVTSDFHMKRARRHFEAHDLAVQPVPARLPLPTWPRLRNLFREWGATRLETVRGCK